MTRSLRMLSLLTLAVLLSIPAVSFAGDRSRSDRRSGSSSQRSDDGDRGRRGDSARGDRSRSKGSTSSRSAVSSSRSDGRNGSSSRTSSSSSRYDGRRGGTVRSTSGHHHHRASVSTHRTRFVYGAPRIVVTSPRVVVRNSYPRRYIEPMYMSRPAFEQVMWDLSQARFDDDRIAIISHVARVYTVNTDQVMAMVSELRFSDNRVNALADIHPRVRDQHNWYRVYDLLTFSNDRRRLRSRCGY